MKLRRFRASRIILLIGLLFLFWLYYPVNRSNSNLTSILSKTNARPFLFAHRGVIDSFPENSLGALEKALRLGFTGLEIDVEFSSDHTFFLFHDRESQRMLRQPGITCKERFCDLEKKKLYLGDSATNENVLSLKNAMTAFNGRQVYYLDLKGHGHSNPFSLARDIHGFLKRNSLLDQALVGGGSPVFHFWANVRYPDMVTIMEGFKPALRHILFLIPPKMRPAFFASTLDCVTPQFSQWLNSTNLIHRYLVYGVEQRNYQRALDLGMQYMIVDYFPGIRP